MLKIFTTPACVQCETTKRYLDRQGIEYLVVDLATNSDAMEEIRAKGFTQAPVVMTDKDSWSGFRLDKLKEFTEQKQAA